MPKWHPYGICDELAEDKWNLELSQILLNPIWWSLLYAGGAYHENLTIPMIPAKIAWGGSEKFHQHWRCKIWTIQKTCLDNKAEVMTKEIVSEKKTQKNTRH